MIVSTSFIVLDKHPCRESALVLRGITPENGKFAIMVHGAEKNAVADKYHELDIEFKDDAPSEIKTVSRVELLESFERLAEKVRNFAMAERIGAFLLKNMPENLAHPYTYDTLHSVLSNLADIDNPNAWSLEQCAVVIKCTYLYENGLLPDGTTPEQAEFLENLVASGIDNSELPACPANYWQKLNSWLNNLLDYQNLSR